MWKACSKEWPAKWLKVIDIISICLAIVVLVVCSNNDNIWHLLRYITTHTVYVTGDDLEKSFIFENIVEITCHMHFKWYKYTSICIAHYAKSL